MKKYLVVLLLFISTVSAFAADIDIVPKLSVCLPGTFRSDYEVDIAVNIGAEARYFLSDYFAVALGFDYLINRNVGMGLKASRESWGEDQHYTNSKFTMLPVYAGILCYPFGNIGEYKPYLRIDGGYNVYLSISNGIDTKPGYYVAGGFGFELYERYIFELYAARYEGTDNDDDISYKNILFKFGYKFTI
ncbi:MAG: porin family protein [Endomicrobiaceae bacterium]|nr:porin family protein [Endomicrobiaceae bacterium]